MTATLKKTVLALVVGSALVGIAALVAAITGDGDRFYQACGVLGLACVAAALVMSGSLFVGSNYESRASNTQLPAPAAGNEYDDPVDAGTRSRLRSGYVVLAGLPAIVIAVLHYTT